MRRGTRARTPALVGTLVLGLTLAAATAAAPAASEPQLAAGKLELRAKIPLLSGPLIMPCTGPPSWEGTACQARSGTRLVRGLGNVSVSYIWLLGMGPPTCSADFAKPLPTTGFLSVAGKGRIDFALAEGARCLPFGLDGLPEWLYEPQEFTIIRGTGPFAGASGRGKRVMRFPPSPEAIDVWTGTLEVPGLKFDVTAPKLHGAGSKTVRAQNGAKSARVTFKVTATDGVDGDVRVSCRPRSGSPFKIGKTRVACSATDSSGNTARATFTVTVRR
jgi:hypothetical protein